MYRLIVQQTLLTGVDVYVIPEIVTADCSDNLIGLDGTGSATELSDTLHSLAIFVEDYDRDCSELANYLTETASKEDVSDLIGSNHISIKHMKACIDYIHEVCKPNGEIPVRYRRVIQVGRTYEGLVTNRVPLYLTDEEEALFERACEIVNS